MELYTFGFNWGSQLQAADSTAPPTNILTPTCVLRAKLIKLLWSSWCDAVIAYQTPANHWRLEYTGTGLTDAQRAHIVNHEDIKKALYETEIAVDFFGTALHDGLRGYVASSSDGTRRQITLLATDLEIAGGIPEIESYSMEGKFVITAIRMGSGEDVFISRKSTVTGDGQVLHFQDLAQLRKHLASDTCLDLSSSESIASFVPTQWCSNSTTATSLDPDGETYTATRDPRYPKCLGRSYEDTGKFDPVPYLSETRIQKIASGGYMTAAVSSAGELFLWGQACPGSAGELVVLRENAASNGSQKGSTETGISLEGEQDDFVKCLTVRIDGEEAWVYDVVVGHGHVLVAAEVKTARFPVKRTVFAAGDGSKGQLGLTTTQGFVEEFDEISELRGKTVEQFAAAGWSSFVVSHEIEERNSCEQ